MNRQTSCFCAGVWIVLLIACVSVADESAESQLLERHPAPADAGPSSAAIELDLWALTLGPLDDEANDAVRHVLTRVRNMSSNVGDREAVRRLIDRLDEQKVVRQVHSFRVATLDGHNAKLQIGVRKPRITATSQTQFGVSNSIVYEPLGVVLWLTPHVEPDGMVRVIIDCATSELREADDVVLSAPVEGEKMFAVDMVNWEVRSVVRVKDGEAQLVAAMPVGAQPANSTNFLILRATVLK